MKASLKKHLVLIVCSGVSLFLLALFFFLRRFDAQLLALGSQWLIVAGVPILVGLLAGGYINKFKGFGVELEAKLETPIRSLTLLTADAIRSLPFEKKGSPGKLHRLFPEQKANIQRLRFVSGEIGYIGDTVREYYEDLWNLEYVEVVKPSGQFVCLIPIDEFKAEQGPKGRASFSHETIEEFVRALEQDSVLSDFSESCITMTVKHDEPLIDVLKDMRDYDTNLAVVVSPGHKFRGTVTANEVERRIADDVLNSLRT